MNPIEPLATAARQGDGDALRLLIETLWPYLFRVAFGITHNRQIAEDSTQEACASILRSIASLKRPSSVKTWATHIVVREARHATKRERSLLLIESSREESAISEKIDIARALSRLSVMERELVVLRYFADLDSKEIAQALGVPRGTIRFRLFLARRHLRALLDPAQGPPASPVSSGATS